MAAGQSNHRSHHVNKYAIIIGTEDGTHSLLSGRWPWVFVCAFLASRQNLPQIVRRLVFQSAFMKITMVKTVQNESKPMVSRVVVIVGIRHSQDPKPYRLIHLLL